MVVRPEVDDHGPLGGAAVTSANIRVYMRALALRLLRNADFTTAKRIAAAINDYLGVKTAEPIDPSTVQLSVPTDFKGNVVAFLTDLLDTLGAPQAGAQA